MSEFAAIARLVARIGRAGPAADVHLGVGDDAAVLGGRWPIVCVDTLVEGVHWDPRFSGPADVGFKLLACNLSDLAAMGARPGPFLLALSLPTPFDETFLDGLADGIELARRAHGLDAAEVAALGGDTTRSPSGAVLSLTLFGRSVREDWLLTRSGGRPGDGLWVSGPLGEAAAGLALLRAGVRAQWADPLVERHLRPRARLDLVSGLAEAPGVHAGIDLSDGLAGDLGHLAIASGCSAVIDARALPSSPAFERATAALAIDPVSLALSGGEDFELLVAAAASADDHLEKTGFSQVGRLTHSGTSGAITLVDEQGVERPLAIGGYDHDAPEGS